MIKKIVSFGDSFIRGSEIENNLHGEKAWPGLISHRLNLPYSTYAENGVGNDHIAQQIYKYVSNNKTNDTLFVINWTWCMRWDIFIQSSDTWANIGPTCVPDKLSSIMPKSQAEDYIEFYQKNISNNVLWNTFRNLQTIYAAQCYLKNHNICAIQTFMDNSLFASGLGESLIDHYQAYKDPSWPACNNEDDLERLPEEIKQELADDRKKIEFPKFIHDLQFLVKQDMMSFDGLSFLEWSKKHKFTITELLHPLDEAHLSAADLWEPYYREIINEKS